MLVWPLPVVANDACLKAAKTELERDYCKIVSGGEGAGLPSFEDFRRNDPLVQSLLLKRPAERLGLKLPNARRPPAAPPEVAPPRTTPAPAPNTTQPVSAARPAQRSLASDEQPSVDTSDRIAMDDCRFTGQGDVITCSNSRYVLAANKQNKSLGPGALADANQMNLPPYRGARSDNDSVIRYLSEAYAVYIQKMLEIGLGAATLSFTEFHQAFHTTEAAGIDFAGRSEETFQLLKADRKTMGIQSRLHDKLPPGMGACMEISRDIIVCDNVGTNWVYVRSSKQ